MKARGYLVEAEFDGKTLTARGTNKAGQVALRGEQHGEGDLSLTCDQIARVEHKAPALGGMVNGNLILHTVDGTRYQLHFRKKSAEEFEALADALKLALQS